MAGKTHLE